MGQSSPRFLGWAARCCLDPSPEGIGKGVNTYPSSQVELRAEAKSVHHDAQRVHKHPSKTSHPLVWVQQRYSPGGGLWAALLQWQSSTQSLSDERLLCARYPENTQSSASLNEPQEPQRSLFADHEPDLKKVPRLLCLKFQVSVEAADSVPMD